MTMQFSGKETNSGRRTSESLRLYACAVAIKLRNGIARVAERDGKTDADASSRLFSLCGNLDQLDQVVRKAIGIHPRPIPPDLIDLHKRISACVDAAVDLAGRAFDDVGPGAAKSASNALVKVQSLLALVDPAEAARAASIPPPPEPS
jgi:hypothetical protein